MLSNACDHMVSSLGTLQLLMKEMIVFASLVFSCDFFSMMNHGSALGRVAGRGGADQEVESATGLEHLVRLVVVLLGFLH